jgi:hypothetical protein
MVNEMLDSYLFKFENFLLTPLPQWVLLDYILITKHQIRNKHACSQYQLSKKRFEC